MKIDFAVGFVFVLAAACASGPPATDEQVEQMESRLLQPFVDTADVGCGELHIDITGNFHRSVGQPAIDPSTQTVTREQASSYREIVWTNTTGDLTHALRLTIGQPPTVTDRGIELQRQTRFQVLNQVRLRIHEDRRPLQLDVRAFGDVVVVRPAGGKPQRVAEFVVTNGVATAR